MILGTVAILSVHVSVSVSISVSVNAPLEVQSSNCYIGQSGAHYWDKFILHCFRLVPACCKVSNDNDTTGARYPELLHCRAAQRSVPTACV